MRVRRASFFVFQDEYHLTQRRELALFLLWTLISATLFATLLVELLIGAALDVAFVFSSSSFLTFRNFHGHYGVHET